MVRKFKILGLFLTMFWMFGLVSLASEDSRIEQINGEMPEIDVYFYADEMPESVTIELEGEIMTSATITDTSESITNHFFLVDCSTSISTAQMNAVKTALTDFVNQKDSDDTVTLIGFGTTIDVLVDTETDSNTIIDAVNTLAANQSDTLFFDSLAKAAAMAEELPEMERCVLYVFSDSVDYNLGGYTESEVENLLNNAGLPLYGFGFDSGNKEDLDNFGALTRATGGAISVVNAENLVETFQNVVEETNSVYIASFTACTNILPSKGAVATITIDETKYAWTTNITEYIPDDIVPEILSVTQLDNGTVEVQFSEDVSGANVTDNFIVKDSGSVVVAVTSAVYDQELHMSTITFASMPETGTICISTSNINDISQDANLVITSVELEYVNLTAVDETEIEAVDNKEDMTGAYVAMILLVIVIATIIIVVVIAKRKKIQEEETLQSYNMDTEMQNFSLAGESGKAHFQAEQESQKKIILEVANISGVSNQVELAIAQTLFVGRSNICDVVFDDIKMSRQHFVLEDSGEFFTITNLSQGGTVLNGVPLNGTRPIRYGDVIEAGAQRIVFKTI